MYNIIVKVYKDDKGKLYEKIISFVVDVNYVAQRVFFNWL